MEISSIAPILELAASIMTLLEHKARIIKEIFKPLFKMNGFNISGLTFVKNETGFSKLFNIQSSSFNSLESVSFYLNIGFLFPIAYEIKEINKPKKLYTSDCQFQMRSDDIIHRNQWYELKIDTNIPEFEKLLLADLTNHIIPFFDKYHNIEDLIKLSELKTNSFSNHLPYVAFQLIKNGNLELGNQIIDDYISKTSEYYGNELNTYRNKLIKNTSH